MVYKVEKEEHQNKQTFPLLFSPFKLINPSFLAVSSEQVQHKALLAERTIKHLTVHMFFFLENL